MLNTSKELEINKMNYKKLALSKSLSKLFSNLIVNFNNNKKIKILNNINLKKKKIK